MRRLGWPFLAAAILVASVGAFAAVATWLDGGDGAAAGRATTVGAGAQPSVSLSGRNASVSWSASQLANGAPVQGYRIARLDGFGSPQIVGAGCAGVVTTSSCTEAAVPAGTWTYTVTPVRGLWSGPSGPASAAVVVSGPSLTLSSSPAFSAVPQTLNGTVAGFVTGETVTVRLDDASTGTVLASSLLPSPIPASGSSALSFTIPAGTSVGAHTVYAIGSSGSLATVGVVRDTTAPTVTAAAVQKSAGGAAGAIRQGGTYYVYANATDAAAGVASATANVSTVTTGVTAVPLSSGSWTVGATTYGWRSSLLTANATLTAGSKAFSITATDLAGNAATGSGFSVLVDNTAPTVSAVVVQKATGGTTNALTQGGTFYVYANAADASAGLQSVTADVGTIDAGQTSAPMTAGSWIVGSTTYGFRSALLTAASPLAQGVRAVSATATDGAGNASTPASANVTIDTTAPVVSTVAIQKSAGGVAGWIRQGGTYLVYANVSDAGGAGLETVSANVNAITTGQTSVAMTAGSWTIGGITYTYRSAALSANAVLAAGVQTFSVSATDGAGNGPTSASGSVTVDDTAPAGSAIQTANTSGGTVGRAEAGDTITYTFTEPIEPISILAGWTGGSTSVTVRLNNNGTSDNVMIYDAANSTQLSLGTIALGRTDYTSGNRRFTSSTMTLSGATITIVLGTPNNTVGTAAGSGTMSWTPSASATDLAGNGCSTAVVTEGGSADREF